MERALDLNLIRDAVGPSDGLPTAEELRATLAGAEVALFAQRPDIDPALIETGWWLHGAASADPQFEVYSAVRQRRAFQVSAHIFDLALAGARRDTSETLRMAFAAQIGFRRAELDPNASAIHIRVRSLVESLDPDLAEPELVALRAGVSFLGFQPGATYRVLRQVRATLRSLAASADIQSLAGTMFAPAEAVVEAVYGLLWYLRHGDVGALDLATSRLRDALGADGDEPVLDDLDARWVAAHLLSLTGELRAGSVWAVLPPDVPAAVKRAMTFAAPPVLTLWRPQRELLGRSPANSPFSEDVRRLVLSLPTSAGKTLVAQLLVLAHVARFEGAVCFVTPMRSLAREVRRSLASRLHLLGKELGRDLADYLGDELLASDVDELQPSVDVMTPERLTWLLRADAPGVLEKYSMFVFDEAQLLGERGRGLLLEGALGYLHWKTAGTQHRIVLLSAALGNSGQIARWLNADSPAELFESEWRGARRLHATFTTDVRWDEVDGMAVSSADNPYRIVHPLEGVIHLRPTEGLQTFGLRLVEPVGEIAFRYSESGVRVQGREAAHTTPFYKAVAALARVVAASGPVLTVTSTRANAAQTARAIADGLSQRPDANRLADYLERRLGGDHPLPAVAARGVAYHHGALPTDVLEAIEEGFREGSLTHVVCTTTLTDGVNLPARTVILYETTYPGQPAEARLAGGRLVNAIGRAGRAGKESEGWVILALQESISDASFSALTPSQADLTVMSQLASGTELATLASYEQAVSAGEDAVFSSAARDIDGFISFVWFLLASEEAQGVPPTDIDLSQALNAMLAFRQLDASDATRWVNVAETIRETYSATEANQRTRWSKAGTSVGTARELMALAEEIAAAASSGTSLAEPEAALELLVEVDALERLLALPEAPREWRFKRSRGGPVVEIAVPVLDLLTAWIDGSNPTEMADEFLSDVTQRDFAVEQIVDATAEHFEHHLSWALGIVTDEANRLLLSTNNEVSICPALPLYVRYGVRSMTAVDLLTRGLASRPVAAAIAEHAELAAPSMQSVTSWLAAQTVAEWRSNYAVTPGDVLDLLTITRRRDLGALSSLLATGVAVVNEPTADVSRTVRVIPGPGPAGARPLVVVDDESQDAVGMVPTSCQWDVQAMLDSGVIASIRIGPDGLHFLGEQQANLGT